MPLSTETYSMVHSKQIPLSASWGGHVRYTFPTREGDITKDESRQEIYRFPYSPMTFWVNFRIGLFYQNGNTRTDCVRARLYVITAEGIESNLISWKCYCPNKWYSTRWPLPSLPSFNQENGIYLQIDTSTHDSTFLVRIDLQGFENVYQPSGNYILIDEEDRHSYLFKRELNVKTGRIQGGDTGSIHDIFDNDLLATHGCDSNEIEGICLFPLGSQRELVFHS